MVHQDPLDLLVLLELTGLQVQKGTWDHKENQAHLGSRESPEHRVFLVLKAPLDHLVKKDLRAGRGYLDYLELMGHLVILVRRVHLERKEHRVQQVHRVLLVILVLVVSRGPMVSVVSRGQKERRARMVSQVSRVTWESKETGVRLVCLGPVERMVLRVLKAELAPTESQAPLVLLEKRVNWVFQDCQVIQEDKDLRVQAGSLGFPEPTARKEPGVLQANLVQEGREVQQVLVGVEEPEVQPGNQVPRAQQATTVLQAHLAKEGLKDLRDQWVSQDQRAPLDHLERMGCPDTLVSVVRRVSKEKLVHQAQEELSAPRDQLERPVLLVREATLDPLAHPESKVFQVLLARREQREILDHRDPLAKTVPLVFEASLEREVYLAPRVQQV